MKNSLIGFYFGCLFTYFISEIATGLAAIDKANHYDNLTGAIIGGKLQSLYIPFMFVLFLVVSYFIIRDGSISSVRKIVYIILLFLIGVFILLGSMPVIWQIFGSF